MQPSAKWGPRQTIYSGIREGLLQRPSFPAQVYLSQGGYRSGDEDVRPGSLSSEVLLTPNSNAVAIALARAMAHVSEYRLKFLAYQYAVHLQCVTNLVIRVFQIGASEFVWQCW